MIQKLKMLMLSLSSLLIMAAPLAVSTAVSADTYNPAGAVCKGTGGTISGGTGGNQIEDKSCQGTNVSSFQTTVKFILNLLSTIVGVAAVIMIIVAGLRYVTSGGKEEGVKNAKNTIMYAIIGLVVVALAQIIVHFVLTESTNITSPS